MPIRVAYIDHTASLSGGEIALLNLVAHLDRATVVPIVILFEDGPLVERLRAVNVETHVIPADRSVLNARKDRLGLNSVLRIRTSIALLVQVLRVRQMIGRLRVDIVHTNSLKADLIGGLAGRLAGKWVIWHVRDRIERDYLPGPIVRLFRTLARWVPHHVVANSHATLATLRLGGRRHRRQSVVYSGVVIHDGTPLQDQTTPTSGLDGFGKVPIVGLIGRISRWKGQHVLLRAAARLRDEGLMARYRLIGSPMFGESDYERELHKLAADLRIADVVEFTGFRSDIPSEIAMLDLLVHTSITPEPFGQVIVEGMAAGKPVIATRGGGALEIIEDGLSGILVPPGDDLALARAIVRLLADPDAARRMGDHGRRRVKACFTIDRVARDVEALYRSLTRRQRP